MWIVVVSHKAHVGRLVQVNLERQGWEVSWRQYGEDALIDLIDENAPPRIIIWDSGVPDVEFAEALRELNSDPDTGRIPLIALIESQEDADIFRESMSSRDCFLMKPFNPMELIACVRRILQDHDNYSGGAPAWSGRI